MPKQTESARNYRDGDAIFLENDPGGDVFEIIKGTVELSKTGEGGRIRLALLHPGQTFGGMESLENGHRAATARALGMAAIKVLPSGEPATQKAAPLKPSAEKPGVFQRFLGALSLGGNAKLIEIRVIALAGDVKKAAEAQTRHLANALNSHKGVRAHVLNKGLPLNAIGNLEAAAAIARQWLAETSADLIILGEIPKPGTTLGLRFVSAKVEREDIPGLFGLFTTFHLPINFGPELKDLLMAVSLAAITPQNEAKIAIMAQLQKEVLQAAIKHIRKLPPGLTTRERTAIHMCMGNALAREAARRNFPDYFQMAAQSYHTALEGLGREDSPLNWALTKKHLGSVMQALAERSGDKETMIAAAKTFGDALEEFTMEKHPLEWALVQNRLGVTLYKLDLASGNADLVTQALTAFQNALKIFNRNETPQLWADALNNFAQAALVLGEKLHNHEVLEKAASACRLALEVRTKEKTPMQWASTQNNLGSALFMLGKLKKNNETLLDAAEVFEKAHNLYKSLGAEKMAAVAQKNLSHVNRLIKPKEQPPAKNGRNKSNNHA